MSELTDAQIEAFWSKIDVKSSIADCWEWTGAKKPTGYGNVRINNECLIAHRVAFELKVRAIPTGMLVCHICDNPSCCNPSHLMLCTAKSNSADMVRKGRAVKTRPTQCGEQHYKAKLTASDVRDIRKRYFGGTVSQRALASEYGVSQALVSAIVLKKIWRQI